MEAVADRTSKQPARTTAPFMNGAWRVFDLSIGEMLWSRRTIFMALVVGAPVLVALVMRIVQSLGLPPLTINGTVVDGASIFGALILGPVLRFIVPILGVFYGTSLIADEVEDKTITYLFTRPIRRSAILVGKYIAYLACTTLVVLPALMLVYFLLVPLSQVAGSFTALLIDLGLLAIGLAAYGAVFALVGVVVKRPLVASLIFAFGWEQVALIVPGYLRRFTVMYYLQGLVPHAAVSDSVVAVLEYFSGNPPSATVSTISLLFIVVAALGLAGRIIESREYVLDQ
ncbi:MAG TPA: ABC transporter permease [Vicinamibacterales bacterium]|nr:ABC transporter permease [Vicinamibacterales bacterium]